MVGHQFGSIMWKTNDRTRDALAQLSSATSHRLAGPAVVNEIACILGPLLDSITSAVLAGKNGIPALDNMRRHVDIIRNVTAVLIANECPIRMAEEWVKQRAPKEEKG